MEPIDDIARLVQHFQLLPHPEGGFYRETYRADTPVQAQGLQGPRAASTAIYYLLAQGAWSAWHRIDADEMWHFYAGQGLKIHCLGHDGVQTLHLGSPLNTPQASFQVLVPGGRWFAAELAQPDGYCLAGCTVAPGFEFAHFELADITRLHRDFPEHGTLIERLAPKT